ncbi:GNAT family N-acetyltransferase [Candidatus Thorarchaeota archaeon]|nr:MAG: GNAT family N-acetyltransferase [Candidatus Thorarchaeota archaeon]
MNVDIEIKTPQEIGLEELVKFTMEAEQQRSSQLRCGTNRQEVEKHIKETFACEPFHYISARYDGRLLGLAGCYGFTESMMYLEYWHPLVLPGDHYNDIFQLLVRESIKHTKSLGRNRLEIFLMKITDDIRFEYEQVRPLYEAGGMKRGHEWTEMVCDLTKSTLDEQDLPDDFSLKPIIEVTNDEIWPTYNATFLASGDRRYLNQTEAHRRENFDDFFDRKKPWEEEASLLLYFEDQIVGFHKINLYDFGGFVNGVGIHPDFRRRGLGKILMMASLVRAAKNGMKNLVLEVDIDNHRAIGLYEQLGFIHNRGSISHVWTA